MDTRDGVKVTMPDGWFLVRGSNTEPIIRIVAEAKSEDQARKHGCRCVAMQVDYSLKLIAR